MINKFAELTGDHQWIHVDVERAKRESPFKGTIAHGFLTLSLLPMLRAGVRLQGRRLRQRHQLRLRQAALRQPGAGRRQGARPRAPGRRRAEAEGHAGHAGDRRARRRQDDRPALTYTMLVLYHPAVQR